MGLKERHRLEIEEMMRRHEEEIKKLKVKKGTAKKVVHFQESGAIAKTASSSLESTQRSNLGRSAPVSPTPEDNYLPDWFRSTRGCRTVNAEEGTPGQASAPDLCPSRSLSETSFETTSHSMNSSRNVAEVLRSFHNDG